MISQRRLFTGLMVNQKIVQDNNMIYVKKKDMGKIEEKIVNTLLWVVKISAIMLLFIVMVRSCSGSATQIVPNTTGCQCGCSCVADTSSCKQCDEKIRTIVKEELDKQLLEVFD